MSASNERVQVDNAIRALWCALSELSKQPKGLSSLEVDLFFSATNHPAVQDRLAEVFKKEAG